MGCRRIAPGWSASSSTHKSTYIVYGGLVPVQEQYTEVTSDCATYSYPYTVEENLLTMPGSGEVLALTDSNGANMVPLHDALGSTQWMVNHSITVNIKGESFRLKEKLKAGLIRPKLEDHPA